MSHPIQRKVVLVAGGTGFIGKTVISLLIENGFDIICLSRMPREANTGSIRYATCDITKKESVGAFLREFVKRQDPDPIWALINLVGIKLEDTSSDNRQTFRQVHVEGTRNMLRICQCLKISFFLHMSVLCARRVEEKKLEYVHTKWEAEQLIKRYIQDEGFRRDLLIGHDLLSDPSTNWRTSSSKHHHLRAVSLTNSTSPTGSPVVGRKRSEDEKNGIKMECVILRPSIVFGPGDDMISNLVRSIKLFGVFPLPGWGQSLHQPVHVSTLAATILEFLNGQTTNTNLGNRFYGRVEEDLDEDTHEKQSVVFMGRRRTRRSNWGAWTSQEVVGPRVLTMRKIIEESAVGIGLPILCVPTPIWIERIASEVMIRVMKNPLITPSQLKMLHRGMIASSSLPSAQSCAALESLESRASRVPSLTDIANDDIESHGQNDFTVFSPRTVWHAGGHVPSAFGGSWRLIGDSAHYEWLEAGFRSKAVVACAVLPAFWVLFHLVLRWVIFPDSDAASEWWRGVILNATTLLLSVSLFYLHREDDADHTGAWGWKLLVRTPEVHPKWVLAITVVLSVILGVVLSLPVSIVSWGGGGFDGYYGADSWFGLAKVIFERKFRLMTRFCIAGSNNLLDELVLSGNSSGIFYFALYSALQILTDQVFWRCIFFFPLVAITCGSKLISAEKNTCPEKKRDRKDGFLGCLVAAGVWGVTRMVDTSSWGVSALEELILSLLFRFVWSCLTLRFRSVLVALFCHLAGLMVSLRMLVWI
eukprot:TRINITY_DN5429_c0_g1_i1.p1 TRINITY_DN5429_c0_g1~~TRINITY_DN5429_c0_g1_i1.p1  ORF type:complete len:775 (+),score=139.77 TRINITY_DN5429_c0_g1_i1:50-2326(+)